MNVQPSCPKARPAGTERSWIVDGLRLSGMAWGDPGSRPVLALHGWLDHAESFAELAPRLDGCHVVCLDMPGQGNSDFRSADATYNIWDDIPQILGVMDALEWNDCILLGHSRGAIVGAFLAALRPGRVRAFVALDAISSRPAKDEDVVKQLRSFLDDTARLTARGDWILPSKEDFHRRRQDFGNSPEVARRLAERALETTAEGVRVKADPRLQAASAFKLNRMQIETVLKAIEAPTLILWATRGLRGGFDWVKDIGDLAGAAIPNVEIDAIEGDHHFHLDPEIAPVVAQRIMAFLGRVA